MIAVDTNILVHAHREESEWHREANLSIKRLAEGDLLWGLPVFCLAEFVRLVTHPAVFEPPTSLKTALAYVDKLVGSPSVRILLPSNRYVAIFKDQVKVGRARGNLAFDAQLAAVCLERGARLLTQDRDFSRFKQLATVDLEEFAAD